MNTPFFYVAGLPLLDDPAAACWLDQASALALALSREINGDDATCHLLDRMFIQVAAHEIWRTSGGDPCWTKLEVEPWFERLVDMPFWEGLGANAVITTLAFYHFLVAKGHVSREAVLPIVDRLRLLATPIVHVMLTRPPDGWLGASSGAPS